MNRAKIEFFSSYCDHSRNINWILHVPSCETIQGPIGCVGVHPLAK